MGIAESGETRPFRVLGAIRLEDDGTEHVRGTAGRSHEDSKGFQGRPL